MDRKTAVLERLDIAGLVNSLFDPCLRAGENQAMVRCPEHGDKNPSCSINTKSGLWNCKACGASGSIFDLFMAVHGGDFPNALKELENRCGISLSFSPGQTQTSIMGQQPPPDNKTAPRKGKTVATYRYLDAAGTPCYLKRRIEPGRNGRSKEFAFAHYLPDGNTASGRGTSSALLYGLHQLACAPPDERVFIAEGESKVDALHSWDLLAVCTDSGAKSRWPEAFNHLFSGREVVILPDNDPSGEEYAATVATALAPAATSVKVLRLPGLPEKGDLLDWIDMQREGGTHA